jgi:hypothetical protein
MQQRHAIKVAIHPNWVVSHQWQMTADN